MQQGGSFSRREWLFLIALLLMAEAWLLNVSYVFKSDQDVINYISFAATIASLLLAVIAIIYGFYQSDGQSKLTAAIDGQLSKMHFAQDQLVSGTISLQQQVKSMSQVADAMQRISSTIDSTHAKLGVLEGGIANLLAKQEGFEASLQMVKASSHVSFEAGGILDGSQEYSSEKIAERILRQTSFQSDIIGYALWHAFKSSGKLSIPLWAFIRIFIAEPLGPSKVLDTDRVAWRLLGAQLVLVLGAVGCLQLNIASDSEKTSINISDSMLSALEGCAVATQQSETTKAATELIKVVQWPGHS